MQHGDPLLDHGVRAAIATSHLRHLPRELLSQVMTGVQRREVAAGRTLHRAGDRERHVELVVRGLIRVHVSAPDGRTLTVRYCRPGGLMGIVSLYAEPFVMQATTQAVVDSQLVGIDPDLVRQLADRDVRVAKVLLLELSERVAAFTAEIGGTAFSTVRQRVARHLLDLATHRQLGHELTADISQQELADTVGTVREVIVRALRELRREGVLETRRGGIGVLAPEKLLAEAYPGPDSRWNTSP
jgi:CRP/FNR family transcriptional regulator, cyclic AMP receptor protein